VLALAGNLWARKMQVEGYTFRPDEDETAALNAVAPRYFATMATPHLLGRDFDARDTAASAKVAIVNERFSKSFFGAQSPIGRRLSSNGVTYEIVGALALIIACLGMFGMMAFQVSRRINEMGVRMALGAGRGDIVALVLREVALMLIVGMVIGGACARAMSGLAGKMLFGVTPADPGVFALAAAALPESES
jgi:ABC-type antimicrobial peptide transport system permease subunit